MDAGTAFRALRRGWFLVVIGALAAAAAAFVMSAAAEPVYAATSTYVISPAEGEGTYDVAESIRTLEDARSRAIVSTFVEVLSSGTIHERGAASVGYDAAVLDGHDVSASILPEANVVQLTVTGRTPELAAELSGAIGASAAATFVDLYKIYAVSLLDPADVPTAPAGRGLVETMILAGILGVAAGAGMALLWGLLHGRAPDRLQSRLASYDRELTAVITPLHGEAQRVSKAG